MPPVAVLIPLMVFWFEIDVYLPADERIHPWYLYSKGHYLLRRETGLVLISHLTDSTSYYLERWLGFWHSIRQKVQHTDKCMRMVRGKLS